MSGGSLNGIHDLRQWINLHSIVVNKRGEDDVNVIRHYDRNAEIKFLTIVMQARVEDKRPNLLRKYPAVICAESYEVGFEVALQMRKLPSIESLRHGEVHVETAALGCPRSKAPRLDCRATWMRSDGRYGVGVRGGSTLGIVAAETLASFARPDSRGRLSPHGLSKGQLQDYRGYYLLATESDKHIRGYTDKDVVSALHLFSFDSYCSLFQLAASLSGR